MVWYGMVWYGMVWYGMVWYGMVWYGMVWYGMVWFVGNIPERFGNSGLSQKTKDTGNTIFQGSKDTWCIGGTHACA